MRSYGRALKGQKHKHLKSRDHNTYAEVTNAWRSPEWMGTWSKQREALDILQAVDERTHRRWASEGNMAPEERCI